MYGYFVQYYINNIPNCLFVNVPVLHHIAGVTCHWKCPAGTWGIHCKELCTCLNGATCDPVNGNCSCTSGWMGVTCSKRKHFTE